MIPKWHRKRKLFSPCISTHIFIAGVFLLTDYDFFFIMDCILQKNVQEFLGAIFLVVGSFLYDTSIFYM